MFFFHHSPWMMIGMFLFWLVVIAAGVAVLALLFPARRSAPPADRDPARPANDPALQILRQRYASGEITREEYEEVLRTLGG